MAGMPPRDWLTLMASGVVMDLVAMEASSARIRPHQVANAPRWCRPR